MARQVINRGNFPNDHAHADSIYVINGKINDMTLDLYSLQSQILSAGDSRFSDPVLYPTTEAKVDAMLTQCEVELKTIGAIPANMIPYDTTLVGTHPTVRRVREGGDYSVYDVKAYGAAGDNLSDDTAEFQVAADAATLAGGALYMPSGTYYIAGKVSVNPNPSGAGNQRISVYGAGIGATAIRPAQSPWLEVGGASAGTYGFVCEGFTVQPTSDLYWGRGAIRFIRAVYLHCTDVGFVSGSSRLSDLYSYTGYLFEFDSCFIVHVDRCQADGRGVYLFEIHSESVVNLQLDTFQFSNVLAGGLALGIIRGPNGGADVHNIKFITPKLVLVDTWPEANVSVETTLTSSPSVGATSFTVASATGLAIGSFMWVGIGATIELVKIGNLAGTTVTTSNALRYAHTSGDQVLMGGAMLSVAPDTHNIQLDYPHVEFCAVAVLNAGGRNIRVTDLYGTCKEVIRNVDNAHTTYGLRVERGEWHWLGSGTQCAIRVTTAGDASGHGTYLIDGPIIDPNTGNPPPTLFLNDAGTTRGYKYANVLSSGAVVTTMVQPSASASVLYESITAGGSAVYEQDMAGSQYMWRQLSRFVGLSDAATVAVDAAAGDVQRILCGASRTIGNPTNRPANGRTQRLTITVYNNSGGAMTTTWSSDYLLAGAWVDPASTKRRSITFEWDWLSVKWVEMNRSAADA